jgi:hypothetical protein
MVWRAYVCSVWLAAIAACGDPVVTSSGAKTVDVPAPLQRDAGPELLLPPVRALPVIDQDLGADEPDAMAAPAVDAGSDGGQQAAPPEPVMQPEPPPPPPVPPPLTVSFEPPGGGFAAPFGLSLRAADPEAAVHYTLDGTIPSSSSPVATTAVPIENTTLVRAIAVRDGKMGSLTQHAYFPVAADALLFSSDLPLVVIDMQDTPTPDPVSSEHVSALIGVFEPERGATQLVRNATLTSRIGIKVRGRSTRYQEKPSYTLELRGVDEEDAPAPLLDMPAEGDWVLYAPYTYDPSLMHNVLGYELSRRIGRYAPRTRYCEVFLVSGALGVTQASYVGIYVLTERISRGDDRVPVEKLEPEDLAEPAITGGYIVQVNDPDVGDQPFTAAGRQFLLVYPKQQNVLPQQTQYISAFIDGVERATSAADGVDPVTGQHYSTLVDVDAFIDHHILNVLIKNPDAFALSSYFHKDRSGPLVAGPLWDLDLAMGANDPWGQRSIDPTQWNPGPDSIFARSFWGSLFSHAEFEQAYWARWNELLAGPFQVSALNTLIAELQQQVTLAEPRNRARWPQSAPRDDSFVAEADALRAWFAARVSWIAANAGTIPMP